MTTRMPVMVEVPRPWLESSRDGSRNQAMFDALLSVLNERDYALEHEDIAFGSTLDHRIAPSGGFRLSYHSCGDSRHVWRLKESPVPWFYSFDRLGFSGWSETAVFQERYRALLDGADDEAAAGFCAATVDWLSSGNLSKYRQDSQGTALPTNFVFFPLQIRSDIVARFTRLDPLAVLRRAARVARKKRIPLLVKRHPYCTSSLVGASIALARAGNPYVIETSASVNELLDGCSSVLVANSGVGFEALLRGKPVYSFAGSEYAGFSNPINTTDEIELAFEDQPSADVTSGLRFASFYLKSMCFDARDPHSIRRLLDVAEASARRDTWCEEPKPEGPALMDTLAL
jgi:hypothetical protein